MTISFAWEGDQSVDYDFVPHVGTAPKRDAEFSSAFNSLYALARQVALRFFDRFLLDFGEADTAKALGLSTSKVKDANGPSIVRKMKTVTSVPSGDCWVSSLSSLLFTNGKSCTSKKVT